MTPELITDLFRNAILIAVIMVSVIIVPGLLVGLVVAVFQAATQINEQTLSFLPRLMITLIALAVAGRWLASMLIDFTLDILHEMPYLIG